MSVDRSIHERVTEAAPRLTAGERRVAEALLDDPKFVAFGTVAQLAARAGSSGPTVMRFAAKLGFDGFVDLQNVVQEEIADQLRPATQRIRERQPSDVVGRALQADLDNVRRTIDDIDPAELQAAIELLADRRHKLFVLASEISGATGRALATQLDQLREGVSTIGGSPLQVARELVRVDADDVVVVMDVRRYERWLLDALEHAHQRGARVIALTDSRLSPLATRAKHTFVLHARGVGPFDSSAGAAALVHAITAALAARLRRSATGRLDAIESAWNQGDHLVDG
jgi:DNA-binding MurR/RpiR family transcriptional regulator